MYEISKKAIEDTRKKIKPCFINFHYYRYLEHVGINYDFDAGYRDASEFKKWLKKDPIKIQRNRLLSLGVDNESIKKIESEVLKRIELSNKKADEADLPNHNELHVGVYS